MEYNTELIFKYSVILFDRMLDLSNRMSEPRSRSRLKFRTRYRSKSREKVNERVISNVFVLDLNL